MRRLAGNPPASTPAPSPLPLKSGPGSPFLPINTWGCLIGMSAWGKKQPDGFMIHKCKHQTCSEIH